MPVSYGVRTLIFASFTKIAVQIALDELIECVNNEINKKEKLWTRPWLVKRPELGCSFKILEEIKIENPKELRMICA